MTPSRSVRSRRGGALPIRLVQEVDGGSAAARRFYQAKTAQAPTDLFVGSGRANEPVFTSPARSYVAMITPLGETFDAVTLNAAGRVPAPKRRLPPPSATGN